jgi:hypothetical protein
MSNDPISVLALNSHFRHFLPSHYSPYISSTNAQAQRTNIEMQTIVPPDRHSMDDRRWALSHHHSLKRSSSFNGDLHSTATTHGDAQHLHNRLAERSQSPKSDIVEFHTILSRQSTQEAHPETHDTNNGLKERQALQLITTGSQLEQGHTQQVDLHDRALSPEYGENESDSGQGVGLSIPVTGQGRDNEVRIDIPVEHKEDQREQKDEFVDIPLNDESSPLRRQPQSGGQALTRVSQEQPQEQVAIDIDQDVQPQQAENRDAGNQQARQEVGDVSCFSTIKQGFARLLNWLNPVRIYRDAREASRVEKQRKAERKLQAAREKQQRIDYENAVTAYFGAMKNLVGKMLGKDVNLVVKPESLQRTASERLLNAYDVDHNRLPQYTRKAVLTVGDKEYQVEFTEKRKADPRQPTQFPYMYPTNQDPFCRLDKKEQEPDLAYPDGKVLSFKLTGPENEKLSYELHPRTDPLAVTVNYTEPGGEKHHKRSYSKLKGSLIDPDIRRGDNQILSLIRGLRTTINLAETRQIIDRQVASQEEQARLKTRLDEALTYQAPQIEDGRQKPTKLQKQALTQYQAQFLRRKATIEGLINQVVMANAEQEKIAQSLRRSRDLPEAQQVLQKRFEALVKALNQDMPPFVLPDEESANGCFPRRR